MLKLDVEKTSLWQQVFLQSKVNGAPYRGDQLPGVHWEWPKDTFLQRRLRDARVYAFNDKRELN